ncbi:hypothetical protein ACFL6I_22380 [candidate division KSB1 bacterium]
MNPKIIIGLVVMIISIALGKTMQVIFVLNFEYVVWRYVSMMGYALTWPLLFLGIYICGVEGSEHADKMSRYFSYKHYHNHAKRLYNNRKN